MNRVTTCVVLICMLGLAACGLPAAPPASTPARTARPTRTATPPVTQPPPTQTPAPPTPAAPGVPANLRTVDWARVVAADPNLNHPNVPGIPGLSLGPYVEVKNFPSGIGAAGYALVNRDEVLYLDLSGDGQEEAVISLFSGGTAGNTGLLVYSAAQGAPALAAALAGYKVGASIRGDQLLVIEPIYNGWEPNCCPSGFFETVYRLQGKELLTVSRTERGEAGARVMTVEHFYDLLSARRYREAYDFLSPAFKQTHPYDRWAAGYQNTLSFSAAVSEGAGGTIKVELTAVEQTASGQVTSRYAGTWTLVWFSTARFKQWLLDKGEFVQVP